jgi:uncharacterized protein YecE (DUF72 family)
MGEILVGTAGWHYPDWKGMVYPAHKTGSFSELAFLAGLLDLVEINSTFYRIPEARSASLWLEQVRGNSRFRFIVKLWQGFTHEGRQIEPASVTRFTQLLAPLLEAGRLATTLIQFPWSFKASPENLAYAELLAQRLAEYPLHIEFRHSSWHRPEIISRLRARTIGWVNIDQPIIGASLGPTQEITSTAAYFRLHGRNYGAWFQEGAGRDQRYNYLYSAGELGEWVEPIKEATQKAEKSYVIFNNHFKGQAVVNSLEMISLLDGALPDIPERLALAYPRLARLGPVSADDGTLTLF